VTAPAHPPGASSGSGGDNGGGGDPLAWYGDSAYGTGDLRDAIEKAGHQAVIKPKPLQAPVQGGLTIDDFTVDEQAGMVTCPAGHTVALSRTRVATARPSRRGCCPAPRPRSAPSCGGRRPRCASGPPGISRCGRSAATTYWPSCRHPARPGRA